MRIPIANLLCGGDYTGVFYVGQSRQPVHLLLDTGSSAPAIALGDLQPGQGNTTDYASHLSYGSLPQGFEGPVIRTSLAVGEGAAQLTLDDACVVAIPPSAGQPFGQADGILGLAYKRLNQAFDLGIDSFQYIVKGVGTPTQHSPVDLPTYFTALESQGIVADRFALYTRRSVPHYGSGDASTDPLNQGFLILGGSEDDHDLYQGGFITVKVVDDVYYNTNLASIAVGQTTIAVPRYPGTSSNAIVDSGTNAIALPKDLYDQVVAAFGDLGSGYAAAISQQSVTSLEGWPPVTITLEGLSGDVTLSLAPETYWQLNASPEGGCSFAIRPFGSPPAILGLPLLNNYYTIFDRSADLG
jgi:hypothetical protein